jgi:HEAT repeat protein
MIADGAVPRRKLRDRRPAYRGTSLDWMKWLLTRNLPNETVGQVAVSLGWLGVFVPEMIQPLRDCMFDPRFGSDSRDAALFCLACIGTPAVKEILITAADTPAADKNDYLFSRGLFGLLFLDDVDVLATQLRKALPHSDVAAYAYGLAGSRDRRGRVLLKQLRGDSNPRVRDAVRKALDSKSLKP